jgi:hypothetical protein
MATDSYERHPRATVNRLKDRGNSTLFIWKKNTKLTAEKENMMRIPFIQS